MGVFPQQGLWDLGLILSLLPDENGLLYHVPYAITISSLTRDL